jgi:hypothetical protein
MEIKCMPNRTGKTTECIKQAHKSGAYIVVINREEALRVSQYAEEIGCPVRFPVTFQELLKTGMKGSFVRNIVIDNGDMILERLFSGLKIEMMTVNK